MSSVLSGGGEMGALMRSIDWSQTPLGPVDSWPQSLRTTLGILLTSRAPIFLWWGPHLIQFYNDAYRPILGTEKHPAAMGQSGRETWAEIWDIISPMIEDVFAGGSTAVEDGLLVLNRSGYPEEGYFNYAYSPIRGESGAIEGVFCVCAETTAKVVGERRLSTLQDLASRTRRAESPEEACRIAADALSGNPRDVPFAALYLYSADRAEARLAGIAGIPPGTSISPEIVRASDLDSTCHFVDLAFDPRPERISLHDRAHELPAAIWPDPPIEAQFLPLTLTGDDQPVGFAILGASARRRLDDEYRGFFSLAVSHIASSIAEARAFAEEHRRVEALAELDRARTQFFSNVSHEFRTPLTLLLGPLSEVLSAEDGVSPEARLELQTAHRNAHRLLRLVNSLLDFSRIEAGRLQARYQATDLAALTTELTSLFRSALERVGLTLTVDCPPLPEPVWVDPELWEKIVLNLLSNAFKFTFEGGVTVRLRAVDRGAELQVIDTGTGIPAHELPRLFDRFYRIEGARGRTFEGAGIGLALVQQLVSMHGGTVRASSTPGRGSTFTTVIPFGSAHLPPDRLRAEARGLLPATDVLNSYLDLPVNNRDAAAPVTRTGDGGTVIVADDNPDMRDYIVRLMSPHYRTVACRNGREALMEAQTGQADLILTDVLMPELDGFGLLRELRSRPDTQWIPVILLSARAGEEERSEGMNAGADDYLAKPFSARELLARVGAHIRLARARREAEQQATRILESITDAFIAVDSEWRYTYLNPEAERLNRRSRQELIGRVVWDVFPELLGSEAEEHLRRAMRDRVPAEYSHHYVPWDIWYLSRVFPAAGGGLSLFLRDITAEKRAEQILRQNEADLAQDRDRLAEIFDQSPAFIAVLRGPDLIVERVNPAAVAMAGGRDGTGRPLLEALPELRNQPVLRLLRWVAKTRRPARATEIAVQLGHTHYLDIACTPLRGIEGGIVIIGYDVTERVRAEAQFRQIAEALPQLVWTASPDGAVEWCNWRWYEFTGVSEAQGLGWAWAGVVHPDDLPEAQERWSHCLATGATYDITYRIRRFDGSWRWFLGRAEPIRDESGTITRWFGTCTDIHDRKTASEALQRSNEDLQQFAYAVSHDLQEPLRMVTSFSQLLERRYATSFDEQGREFLRAVIAGGERLSRMIRDLLAYSRAGADRQRLLQERVDVEAALHAVLDNLRPRIEAAGAIVDHDALPPVWGNATQLEQVFQNLIGNAIKYKHPDRAPRIHVSGHRLGDESVFRVSDNGVGFPPERAEDVFGLFTRFHRAEVAGTGIGLALCRRIVEGHGGRIWAESEPGTGSSFWFTLPAEAIDADDAEPAIIPAGVSVLLVSGDRQRRAAARRQIEADLPPAESWRILEAGYAEEALQLCRTAPGCVVLDNTLPEMSASEFLARMAAEPALAHLTVISFPQQDAEFETLVPRLHEALRPAARPISLARPGGLDSVLAWMTDGVIVTDASWRVLYVNRRAVSLIAQGRELLGRNLWDTFPEAVGTAFWHNYQRSMRERAALEFEEYYAPLDLWFSIRVWPAGDGVAILFQDVSERRRAMDALLQSEQRYRALLEATAHVIWSTNAEGSIVETQTAWERFSGQTPEQYYGFGWTRAIHPDDSQQMLSAWSEARDAGELFECVARFHRLDGEWRWMDCRAVPIRDESGTVMSWVGMNLDVTEDRAARLALEESEERFRTLVEQASDAFFLHDMSGRLIDVNGRAGEWLGYSRESLRSMSMADIHKDFDLELAQALWSGILPGEVRTVYGQYRRHDSSSFPVECQVSTCDVGGRRLLLTLARDVSERRETEQHVRDSEARFRGTFDNAAVGMAHVAPNGKWLRVNQRLCDIVGYTRDELMPITFADITHPDDLRADWELAASLLRGDRDTYSMKKRYIRKDSGIVWVNLTVSLLRDPAGQPECFISVAEDITSQEQAEEQLRRSERRWSLLARFADAARGLDSPRDIVSAALRLLREDLDTDRCAWAEVDPAAATFTYAASDERPGVSSVAGQFALAEMGAEAVDALRAGRPCIWNDEGCGLPFGLSAAVAVPIRRGERLVAGIGVHSATPRRWTTEEVELAQALAERCREALERTQAETALRLTEQAVREREERLRLVMRATNDVIWDWNLVTGRVEWNTSLEDRLGYDLRSADTDTRWWSEHIHPEDRERVVRSIHEVIDGTGEHWTAEYRFARADGSWAEVLDRGFVVRDQSGKGVRMIGSMLDLTDRITAEAALRSEQERLHAALEASGTGTFHWDIATGAVRSDEALERLLGRPVESLTDLVQAVRPEDRPQVESVFESCRQSGQNLEVEFRTASASRWLYSRGRIFRDTQGVPSYMAAACVDINERRTREEEQRRTKQLLDAVLDALPVAIIIADGDGKLVRMNKASGRIWGISAPLTDTLSGYGEWIGYHPGDGQRVSAHEWPLSRAILQGETVSREVYEIDRFDDGERLVVELSAAPVRDESGAIVSGVVACMDVTERFRAEQAVRRSEATLSAVLESLPVGVLIADRQGRLLRDNAAHRELWGVPPETSGWEQYGDWEGYWPDSGKRIEAHQWAMARALLFGEVVKGELVECQPFRGGERKFFLNTAAPVRDAKGNILGGVVGEMDVTEQRRIEQALRESEARFRQLADNISQFAWMADDTGTVFWYNRRWFEYTGRTLEDMNTEWWQSVHHPDHLDRGATRFADAIRTGTPWEDTFPLRRADGEFRWFLSRALPIRDERGEVVRWFGTNTDVTEQLQTEEALRESESRFRQMAEAAPTTVWTADASGRVEYYNSRWFAYTGQTEADVQAGDWIHAIHPDDQPVCVARWMHSLATGEPYEVEVRLRRHDGTWRWFQGRSLPVRDDSGRIVRWIGVNNDIHDQKSAEQGLLRSNEDLRQLAWAASHDLQEPMRMVVTFTQMLERHMSESLDESGRQFMAFVRTGAARMQLLINGLRQYWEVSEQDSLPPERIDCNLLFEDILHSLQDQIRATGAVVEAGPLPVVVAPRRRLALTLQHLISNGVRFHKPDERPRVHVNASAQGREWVFAVTDEGIGIDPEHHEHIFGIFRRLDRTPTAGAGMGLALAARAIEQLGGRIWVESELMRGSTFFFSVPMTEADPGDGTATSATGPRGG